MLSEKEVKELLNHHKRMKSTFEKKAMCLESSYVMYQVNKRCAENEQGFIELLEIILEVPREN